MPIKHLIELSIEQTKDNKLSEFISLLYIQSDKRNCYERIMKHIIEVIRYICFIHLYEKRHLYLIRKVEEISIKVPWGHIAAKWWGPQYIRPIVMLHGWQDNCATFDAIIPLLPRHVSYLALDLPGHGRSSHIPNGMIYSSALYIYVLRLTKKKFDWEKISLCGHSMGAILSFIYASFYPNECDMVIALDALKPRQVNSRSVLKFYRNGLNNIYKSSLHFNTDTEPPSYFYDELVAKLINGIFSSYTEEALQYLLVRGIQESRSSPNKYYFTRDNRLKSTNTFHVSSEITEMACRITAPYCFVKAIQYIYPQWIDMDEVLQTMRDSNPKFELHGVNGDHHVHLTDPDKVSPIIGRFIMNHRPGNIFSKL